MEERERYKPSSTSSISSPSVAIKDCMCRICIRARMSVVQGGAISEDAGSSLFHALGRK